MDSNIADEVLNELFSALESAETQNGAILQLMKDKGLASEEELAPYLRRAGGCKQRSMARRAAKN